MSEERSDEDSVGICPWCKEPCDNEQCPWKENELLKRIRVPSFTGAIIKVPEVDNDQG